MEELTYDIILNRGDSFERLTLNKHDFILEASRLIEEPRKVFLGLGNFLELGDYHTLLDTILFTEEGIRLEKILDKNNRRMASEGNIPYSFFKLAVFFPDFLLKDVPTSCVSIIGKRSRLVPGAEIFFKHIMKYNPFVLTAIPYGIAIEFVRRLGLDKENLISTDYKVKKNKAKKAVYTGGIHRFISGERKNIEIEKVMIDNELNENEVIYIGSGEAGTTTFSRMKNSIAFNPVNNIISQPKVNLYGSSLESLLVLFNFNDQLTEKLMSPQMEEYLPSLIVFSEKKKKSDELINIELTHRKLQKNIMAQRVEHSGQSYDSVVNEINVELKGSPTRIEEVREMITQRISGYEDNPQELVKTIYNMAMERYKSFGLE